MMCYLNSVQNSKTVFELLLFPDSETCQDEFSDHKNLKIKWLQKVSLPLSHVAALCSQRENMFSFLREKQVIPLLIAVVILISVHLCPYISAWWR